MNKLTRSTLVALLATAGLGLSSGAFAQRGTYQSERAVCGHNQQDKAACLREAGAAQEAARRGALTDPSPEQLQRNAMARCDRQTTDIDRRACQDRVRGSGQTTIDGSVMGGGVIRETVTPIPAGMAPMPASTMPSSSMPPSTMQPSGTRSTMPSTMPPPSMPRSTMPSTAPAPVPVMPSTMPPAPATMPPR